MNRAPRSHRLLGALVAVPAAFALLGTSLAATASGALPDNRAYEQVSEVNKAGQDAGPVFTIGTANPPSTLFAAAAADGNGILYGAYGSFAGAVTGFPSSYVARRTPHGWVTTAISPGVVEVNNAPNTMNTSADLNTTAFTIGTSGNGIDGRGPGLYLRTPDGNFVKASGDSTLGITYRGGSRDGGHHIFESTEQLIPGVPAPANAFAPRLYEWADGELRLVDRMPGTDLPSTHGANGGGGGGGVGLASIGAVLHAVSEDGSRIAFISPGTGQSTAANPSRLYLRVDGERTAEVSRSRCNRTAPDPACNAPAVIKYLDAALDGSKILFATTQQLLNEDVDALSDIYSYDVEEDSLKRLSAGVGGAADLAGSSADGRIVYFSADSNKKIYLSKDGAAPRLVALTTGYSIPGMGTCPLTEVSGDGSVLAFRANYPMEDADGNAFPIGLFRYESAGGGELKLVATGSSFLLGSQRCFRDGVLSDDGEYLAFATENKLLPEDRNTSMDVYQLRDDELSLISGGTGDDSRLMMMTPSGRDIFFTTWDRLTPTDKDAAQDIYTARIGGGITSPPMPIHCAGDDCQGPATSAPGAPVVGSAAFGGNGNARPIVQPRKASLRVSKLRRVTGISARLRVRVPDAGRIAVRGRAVRNARRSAPRAGTYRVRIALNRRARRQLAKRKSLRAGLRLVYRSKDGRSASRRVRVRFQQPSGKRAKAKKGGR